MTEDRRNKEADYWYSQHGIAERGRIAAVRHAEMLTDVLASRGLLAEAGVLDDYVERSARRIQHENDVQRWNEFRRMFASLIYEIEWAQAPSELKSDAGQLRRVESKRPRASAEQVLTGAIKALHKLLDSTDSKAMTCEAARREAERRVAFVADARVDGLFELPGGAA